MKKQIQIGVVGSMTDQKVSGSVLQIAKDLGKEIAKAGALLLFGFEGDFDSLSSIAAKSAEQHGGKTVAFFWGKDQGNLGNLHSIRIETGQLRGGGREFSLILSCDAIVSIGGGSGTLTEIGMAYQAGIPVIVIKDSGGWSEKLSGTFLDERRRLKIEPVENPQEAVESAIRLANINL